MKKFTFIFLFFCFYILNINFAVAEKIFINCPSKFKSLDGNYTNGPTWIGEINLEEQSIIWNGPTGFKLGQKK